MYTYSYIDILKSRFVEFLDSFICNESVLWKIINVTLVIYSCSNVSTRHLFIYHSIAIRPFGYGNRARTALEATVSWLTNQDCVDRSVGSWYLFLTFPINLLNYERAMNFFFFFRTTPQGRRLFLPKIREEKRSVFYASFTDERSQGWRSRFFAVIALITKRSRKRFRGSIKADRSNILGVVAIGL